MDVNTMIQLINGVGFPIFACIAMGLFIVWDKKQRAIEKQESITKQYDMLLQVMTAVDNNTTVLKELVAKMGGTDHAD